MGGNIGMNGTESPNVRPYEPTGEGRMREKDIMMWNAKEDRRADESVSSMMRDR